VEITGARAVTGYLFYVDGVGYEWMLASHKRLCCVEAIDVAWN